MPLFLHFPAPKCKYTLPLAFHIPTWLVPTLLPGFNIYFTSNLRLTFTDHILKIPCVLASSIFFFSSKDMSQLSLYNYLHDYCFVLPWLGKTACEQSRYLSCLQQDPHHPVIPSQCSHLINTCWINEWIEGDRKNGRKGIKNQESGVRRLSVSLDLPKSYWHILILSDWPSPFPASQKIRVCLCVCVCMLFLYILLRIVWWADYISK